MNVKTERRHDRRALASEEITLLLQASKAANIRFGLTGNTRALIYRLASETGLRANEIRSLTPESFCLEENPPTVTVKAGYSKHRREDVLPLLPDMASALKTHLSGALPMSVVFKLPDKPVKMLRHDLLAARTAWVAEAKGPAEQLKREKSDFLKYRDRAGLVVDFHALRHTFISNLARGGVHPKLAQDLARHSDINLTLSRYSHTVLQERASALQALRLPALAGDRQAAAVQETPEGSSVAAPTNQGELDGVFPLCFPQKDGQREIPVDCGGLKEVDGSGAKVAKNPSKNADSRETSETRPVRFERTTFGLGKRSADSNGLSVCDLWLFFEPFSRMPIDRRVSTKWMTTADHVATDPNYDPLLFVQRRSLHEKARRVPGAGAPDRR